MTTKKPPQPDVPRDSNRHGAPWRDAPVSYAEGGMDDGTPGFMSALRRFRSRHGLSAVAQQPLLTDDDLQNLRAMDCERAGLNLDDIADTDPA